MLKDTKISKLKPDGLQSGKPSSVVNGQCYTAALTPVSVFRTYPYYRGPRENMGQALYTVFLPGCMVLTYISYYTIKAKGCSELRCPAAISRRKDTGKAMTATVLKESTTLLNSTLPFITEFLTSQT
jgi:hypothetical protein